jgi:DNA-binding NarL/FixJ family response regulator
VAAVTGLGAPPPETASVFLLQQDGVFAWGLQKLIEKEHPRLVHVGTAMTVDEALTLLPHAKPRVILVDMELEGTTSVHVLSALINASNGAVIGFTSSRNPEILEAAVLAGARGILKKTATPLDIVKAIERVRSGELWADRTIIQRLFETLSSEPHHEHIGQQKVYGLSARELEIVVALSRSPNKPLKTIAPVLGVTESTLRTHLSSIYQKLHVAGRLDLYVYAQKHGLAS